jgi:predicted nucleic acid-binding protein
VTETAYFDIAYLAKLHWREVGTVEVETLAQSLTHICCSRHGRLEFAAVGYRKVREGAADLPYAKKVFEQLERDTSVGGIKWLEITSAIYTRAENFFLQGTATTFLRASDALHLACAAEHGFTEIYSNDRHLLAAAPLFGLRALNLIPTP